MKVVKAIVQMWFQRATMKETSPAMGRCGCYHHISATEILASTCKYAYFLQRQSWDVGVIWSLSHVEIDI